MKIILSWRRHHYVARASIFLITVALIAGMVGCGGGGDGDGGEYYALTIASTAGGSVTTPGDGPFTYDEGTVVNLVATPNACCHFVNWTGDVSTIANVGAATTTIIMNGDYDITANFEGEAVTFADPNLEAAVREAIAMPGGPIYPSDLDGLTLLDAMAKNIIDLAGLECATSLITLLLADNQISDISPLANLTSLTELTFADNQISDISPLASLTNLTVLELNSNQISDISPLASLTNLTEWLGLGNNQISDISPLANLTSLTGLALSINQISDISPLANLTNLTEFLTLNGNQISDISPLASLTNLTELGLEWNQISDISSLANLTNLTQVWLRANQISDIEPLVNNPGLSEGDTVYLTANPLSHTSINTYIPQLEARGVIVSYIPPPPS
ncbi:MAG: leucine-rich repeat domain-containing protein [Dehalococcoidia bacterium]